jgi:hypothetical protein
MLPALSDDQVRLLRLRSQRLAGERATGVADLVAGMVGLQAQHTPASRLAVRPRSSGLDAAAVARACNQERSVVRTWAMRGTLHMVAAEDVGWLVALLGPRSAAAGRSRRRQLGLDDDDLDRRALPAIREILAGGGRCTRAELVRRLAAAGVAVDPEGQAPAHLVFWAATQGLVCRGPDLDDDEPTYVLLEDWVGPQPALEPEAALARLARGYLAGHGPAGTRDLAAWAGVTLAQARRGLRGIADELDQVEVAGEPAWLLAGTGVPAPGGPGRNGPLVRLLPHFDAWLLSYRSRDLVLAPRFARRIQAGGGWIQPAVVVDGRVVGTWHQQRKDDRLTVTVAPFERLDPATRPGLEAETADLGRFLHAEATLAVEG